MTRIAIVLWLVFFAGCDAERPQTATSSTMLTSTTTIAVSGSPPTAQEIDRLIASFRSSASSHIVRPGGPPTGETEAVRLLVENIDHARPALLAALKSPDNDIRRHAAFTLGVSKRREFAAPLEHAIADELASRIHQFYPQSSIPNDHYFAALRAMVLAAARTGGLQSLQRVVSQNITDPLAIRALDDSLRRVLDRSPCSEAHVERGSCLAEWRAIIDVSIASGQSWSDDVSDEYSRGALALPLTAEAK